MENTTQTQTHIIRNVVIFTVLVIALGWLGWLIGATDGSSESRDLGSLVFVVSPFAACVALRLFGEDGWQDLGLKPRFKRDVLGYTLSVLIYPVAVGGVLLLGAMFGGITFDFSSDKAAAFVPALLGALAFNFVRNIFEEFGWRGYLTPKLAKLALPNVTAHLITGAIWGIWHLPYYLGLLNASEIQLYTSQNLIVFILSTILGLIAASIAFGEIRLLTGSVWPAVLMHAVSNAIILTLLTGGYARVQPTTELLFTPGMHGILSMVVIVVIGWGLYRRRVQ